ncbi:carbonic anhydrase [Cristinia sonorae]|uniref:Carbonic anhydrase n=1 Tax=Cristinia sonorae TaxID=1940300 RepID=A0A8K0UEI8_9AGAR|nr:carbonic anhydrase [Cristinia sonorae]
MPAELISRLLNNNAAWATDVHKAEPTFFPESAKGQSPKLLWIGCADSRVPESVVVACKPGEIFVHRNIANQFHPEDDNVLSVLTYAVEALNIDHIVVAGHTYCGGATHCYNNASAEPQPSVSAATPLSRWLSPLTDLAREQQSSSDLEDKEKAIRALIEKNVEKQVLNVARTSILKEAWKRGRDIHVHGWVYELESGRLRDLECSVTKENAGEL